MAKQFKPETLCVQAGWTPKKGHKMNKWKMKQLF